MNYFDIFLFTFILGLVHKVTDSDREWGTKWRCSVLIRTEIFNLYLFLKTEQAKSGEKLLHVYFESVLFPGLSCYQLGPWCLFSSASP